MKKKLTALIISCMSFYFLEAQQEFRLNAFAGYVFDDHVDSYYSNTSFYEGTIKGGFRWGGGLEYMMNPHYGLNLMYLTQSTTARLTYYDNDINAVRENKDFDLSAHWIMLGGARYMRKDKFEPYGGFELGMVISDLKSNAKGESASNTNFAWGMKIGSNIWLNEKIGIKLQADLRSAVQAAGGGLYFGTGGAGAGVSSYSTIYQFGLGGGLTFRFPPKTSKPSAQNSQKPYADTVYISK
jgi:hypothetical protein